MDRRTQKKEMKCKLNLKPHLSIGLNNIRYFHRLMEVEHMQTDRRNRLVAVIAGLALQGSELVVVVLLFVVSICPS